MGDNVAAAAAVDKGGVAVDIVVDVLYALHRVLSLLGLADPPLFSLLVHANKKFAISLLIRKDILNKCCGSVSASFWEAGSGSASKSKARVGSGSTSK